MLWRERNLWPSLLSISLLPASLLFLTFLSIPLFNPVFLFLPVSFTFLISQHTHTSPPSVSCQCVRKCVTDGGLFPAFPQASSDSSAALTLMIHYWQTVNKHSNLHAHAHEDNAFMFCHSHIIIHKHPHVLEAHLHLENMNKVMVIHIGLLFTYSISHFLRHAPLCNNICIQLWSPQRCMNIHYIY